MKPVYDGMPSRPDVAAELRHYAQQIADGVRERPFRVIALEFAEDGTPHVVTFGPCYDSNREAIAELLTAALVLNADAAN